MILEYTYKSLSASFVLIFEKISNQKVLSNRYCIMIGWFCSASTKLVLKSFMTNSYDSNEHLFTRWTAMVIYKFVLVLQLKTIKNYSIYFNGSTLYKTIYKCDSFHNSKVKYPQKTTDLPHNYIIKVVSSTPRHFNGDRR